jgi:hypothetical protein
MIAGAAMVMMLRNCSWKFINAGRYKPKFESKKLEVKEGETNSNQEYPREYGKLLICFYT